jgi:hypothetical protein
MKNSSGDNDTNGGALPPLHATPGSAVLWIVEVQNATRPDLWDAVEYPRTEDRAHELVAEWRQ